MKEREVETVYFESKKDEPSNYYLFEEALPKCRLEKTSAIVLSPEEYKEDMVSFPNWCALNYCPHIKEGKVDFWTKETYQNKDKVYTTSELFDLYTNKTTKENAER